MTIDCKVPSTPGEVKEIAARIEPATGDYEIDRQRHVGARQARIAAEVELLTAPPAKIRELRDRRLRALLRHARERSPWHRERLAGLGDDLSSMPTMTKQDLMANWDGIVTDPRLTLEAANRHLERTAETGEPSYVLGEYTVVASGGSSGLRTVMALDFEGFLHHHLAYARAGVWRLRRLPKTTEPAVVAAIYATNPVHISAALARCFSTDRYRNHLFSAARPVGELAAALQDLQPTHLATYPSLLRLLARRGLRLRLRRITTHGEALTDEIRAAAEEAFGVTPENGWGTTETAPLAYTDGVNPGLVLFEDKTVIEPVDERSRPVPPGQRAAKVLVTNVVNRLLPLIRYEVADQVTLQGRPNPGPWTGRLIEPVHGRQDEGFDYGGGAAVHPFTFRAVLGEQPLIAEYQVVQTPDGADVRVCTLGDPDLDGLARRLESALAEAGLPAPKVTLRRVDGLDRHGETGKLRRFVPL